MNDIKKATTNPTSAGGDSSVLPIDLTSTQNPVFASVPVSAPAPTPTPKSVPTKTRVPSPTQSASPTASPRSVSSSPWDEDVPEVPEEKPKIVGNLMPKKEIVNEPLKVPSDVEEKVGKKVPATDFIKKEEAPIDFSESKIMPQLTNSGTSPEVTGTQPVISKRNDEPIFSLIRERLGIILIIIIFFSALAVTLTEFGFLSIGLEKAYGSVGMEQLWGGLSKNSSSALGKSLFEMQEVTSYKTKGNIDLIVDSSAESDITSSLVDIVTGNSDSIPNTTSTNDVSISALTTTQATIETIEADFTMKAASSASEAEFLIKKNGSKINLINKNSDLFVKDSVGSYAGDSALWINYKIPKLQSKNIQTDIFKAEKSQGLSASGERTGNEKIDGIRCFKYTIDSAEIGNSLSSLGITSEMAQNVTGEVWIGVRDKKIHQANLKIIPPITSTTRSITAEINFYDFNIKNTFTTISESDIITTKKTAVTETPVVTTDQTRKQDVTNILAALKNYKSKMGYYPVSSALLKLNTTENTIYRALVPTYITTLPQDPKSTDGWYYAYKSDGIKCSVSARLENQSDPEGTISNGVLLYLKYNND
jgi:hypothetical protein